LERTWTAIDNCGNATSGTQVITVQDTTNPMLSGVPANVTVECNEIPAAATPIASDNCDTDVTISYNEQLIPGGCINAYSLERTWTATDNCGNTDVQTQVITVQDTTDPQLFGVPADVTVECDAVPAIPFVEASDNCTLTPTIDVVDVIIAGNCEDNYIIERTWTATDDCGNSTSETQVITVQDTTDPQLFGVPADITVECDFVPAPAQPVAADNCDNDVDITFTEVRIDGNCEDNYTLERTWIATDNCGNDVSITQIITVQDTSDPFMGGVPADVTVECDAVPVVPAPGIVYATDNCDSEVTIDFNENIIGGNCTDNYIIERTWTATDNCGNDVSQTQIITVEDTQAPMMTGVPADVTVECDNIPAPLTIGVDILATDNCDTDVEIILEENQLPGDCTDSYFISRKYTATDNCGNEKVMVQLITIEDTTVPVISGVPADITADCNEVPDYPAPGVITASDNCDTDVLITFSEIILPGGCPNSYTLTRVWTATDNCNNITSSTQVISVSDVTPPVIMEVPLDATVECDAVPAPPTPGIVQAVDNCDPNVQVLFDETIIPGACEDSYTIIRTWTAIDNCGNEGMASQTIIVQDTTDPIIAGVPADVTVPCDLVPAPAQPIVADNCDTDVTLDFNEDIIVDGCGATITRTWVATDNCGNEAIEVQVITVEGDEPILTNLPNDVTVECNNVPAPANVGISSNCIPNIQLVFIENIIPGDCENNYTIERTWGTGIATGCGSSVSHTQYITVEDTQAPIIAGIPTNMTVNCNQVPNAIQPIVTDNCDTDVTIDFGEITTQNGCETIITRTYTASDNCGNTNEVSYTVTVVDEFAPMLMVIPGNMTVECDAIPAIPQNIFAIDNCDTDVEISFNEDITPGACENDYIITRTWTATDDCGNEDVEAQIITVEDTMQYLHQHNQLLLIIVILMLQSILVKLQLLMIVKLS